MAYQIEQDSAQDEVCVALWGVMERLDRRVEEIILAHPHDDSYKQELDDLIYLMSKTGASYRYHAERHLIREDGSNGEETQSRSGKLRPAA